MHGTVRMHLQRSARMHRTSQTQVHRVRPTQSRASKRTNLLADPQMMRRAVWTPERTVLLSLWDNICWHTLSLSPLTATRTH